MNRRGFSLIELLMVVGITSVVISGISLVLVKQSQASVKQTQQRNLEETGRQALLELAYAVRMAGSGIAPTAAFDFDHYACSTPGTATTCNNNPGIERAPLTPTPAIQGLRDKTDGSDEMVASYRDPVFSRNVTNLVGLGPYTVTIDKALTTTIRQGRIAMLLCSGADPVSYVKFSADAAAGATSLTLNAIQDADGNYPKTGPTDNCFAKASMVLVERVRYFVANDFDGVPALFRDRGRAGDPQVLFRGIEDMQLTYTIGPAPAGSGLTGNAGCGSGALAGWVYGSCNQGIPVDSAVPDPDWIKDGYDAPTRFTSRPANIRSVEINLIARATQASPDKAGDPVPKIGNRPGRAADAFSRSIFKLTEQTPNLLARATVMPG
jgi:prepilin-type N-terminal cleavage/methylation domain-containing protein